MLLISGGIDELGLGSHYRDSGARNSRDAWARSQRYIGKIEYEKIELMNVGKIEYKEIEFLGVTTHRVPGHDYSTSS